jgi:hypothetical protein
MDSCKIRELLCYVCNNDKAIQNSQKARRKSWATSWERCDATQTSGILLV